MSFLNWVSIIGVALGVMALIVVMGVMTGFSNNLREKIIGTTPHIVIEKEGGLKDFDTVIQHLDGIEEVIGSSVYFHGNIFLELGDQAMAVAIRGVDPKTESSVTKIEEYLVDGRLDELRDNGVIIGHELARFYNLNMGDNITVISPGSGLAGFEWRYNLNIVGIFKSGMVDYDTNLIVTHLNMAQQMFNYKSNVSTGVGLKLSDPYQAEQVKKKIYDVIGFSFLVKSWIDSNRNLFEALKLEKWGLFLILTFMIVIASFNIISTLVVTVTSKVHDIGILKSVGVPNSSIRMIFTKVGLFIGSLGTFWGVVAGLSVTYVLKTYVRVPAEIYSIEHVPVEIQLSDILITVAAAMMITFLATIHPARKASQLQPVDALRYE